MIINFDTGNMPYCKWCEIDCSSIFSSKDYDIFKTAQCPLEINTSELLDLSKFESQVAWRLANYIAIGVTNDCKTCSMAEECDANTNKDLPCEWFLIKRARLDAEQDMDYMK